MSRQASRPGSSKNSRKNSLTHKTKKSKKTKNMSSLFSKGIYKYLSKKDGKSNSKA